MRRVIGVLIVILFFSSTLIAIDLGFDTFSINTEAATLNVGTGPGNDSATIQGAIDAANPGDTIFVYAGTYDGDLTINKTLTLMGEDKTTTIIDADGWSIGILVQRANYVNISGFTVLDALNFNIFLSYSNNSHIHGNILTNAGTSALDIYPGSENLVENNNIAHNQQGIVIISDIGSGFFSNSNILSNNVIESCGDRAIKIQSSANDNVVSGNTISGYYIGIHIYESMGTLIENSDISNGTEGVRIFDLSSAVLDENYISDNEIAVRVYDYSNATLVNCTLEDSGLWDLQLGDTLWQDGDIITVNTTFENDKVNILDDVSNLTVKNLLTVRMVNDTGEPVSGVKFQVRETQGFSLDFQGFKNYTSEVDGYVRWIPLTNYWEEHSGKVFHTHYTVFTFTSPTSVIIEPDIDMNQSQQVTITIHSDTDGDGIYDIWDPFPEDPTQWQDTDGDGFGDNGTGNNPDAFPDDPAASKDSDSDGYPDSWNSGMSKADSTTGLEKDAFPDDPDEWKDSDGDGIGDNSDFLPDIHNTLFFALIVLVVVILIVLVLVLRSKKRKKSTSWDDEEKDTN
jgi:parallel beta-helix repeat protein